VKRKKRSTEIDTLIRPAVAQRVAAEGATALKKNQSLTA
jgi:hypothetical protein